MFGNKYSDILRNFLPISFLAFLWGCVTTYDTISNRDFANQYSPTDQYLHSEYYLFSPSVLENRLYFRFFPKEFAYSKSNDDSIPQCRISLFFRVTESESSVNILDSLTTRFSFKGNPRAQFTGFVPVKIASSGHYFIEVFLTDNISQRSVSTVLEFNLDNASGSNSFMPLSALGNPIFKPFLNLDDSFRMRCNACSDTTISVTFYKPITQLPVAPDIPDESLLPIPEIDTAFVSRQLDTILFSAHREGIWFFNKTGEIGGKAILSAGRYFPKLKTAEALLDPLSYILTPKEMERFRNLQNPKIAVDSFWMMNVEELDEARELIRVYYNRVQLANYYFSDYRQGWLTDMGMIYIVCGPPSVVKKSGLGESWIYGQGNKGDVEFYFYKEQHPQFGVINRLHRTENLSRIWFSAVKTWRDGRIYSINP